MTVFVEFASRWGAHCIERAFSFIGLCGNSSSRSSSSILIRLCRVSWPSLFGGNLAVASASFHCSRRHANDTRFADCQENTAIKKKTEATLWEDVRTAKPFWSKQKCWSWEEFLLSRCTLLHRCVDEGSTVDRLFDDATEQTEQAID